MKLMRYDLRVLMALLGTPAALVAQNGPIVTDRPDQTESAVTVRRGALQFESGWSFAHDAGGALRAHSVGESLLRIGLLSRVEGRLGFGGWRREQAPVQCLVPPCPAIVSSGVGDLEVGAKVLVVEERAGLPQLAVIGMTSIPTGEAGFSSDQSDPSVRLTFSKTLTERLALGWNVGAMSTSAAGVRSWDALYTLTMGIGLAEQVGMFVESFGTLGLRNSPNPSHNLDGGFTLQVRDNVQFDIAGGLGLNDAAEDWFVGAGLSVRIPR